MLDIIFSIFELIIDFTDLNKKDSIMAKFAIKVLYVSILASPLFILSIIVLIIYFMIVG